MTDSKSAHEKGYGKPPKEYQWQKGQSPNPSGKRKTSDDFAEVFRRVAYKKIKLVEDGKTKTSTMIEAAMRAPLINALKRNKQSRAYALQLMEEFGTRVYSPPKLKLDHIYRNFEGQLVVDTNILGKGFDRMLAEIEKKNPAAAKAWVKVFADRMMEIVRGKI